MNRILSVALIVLISTCCLYPQGTTQVIISGIPPYLPSPYVSDIENNYLLGRYPIHLTYSSTNPDPVAFVYNVVFIKDGIEIVNITSDPLLYTPGTYIYRTFDDPPRVNFADSPIDKLSGRIQEQVIREGILPEGSYTLEIEVRPVDPFLMITTIPGIAQFEVRFPQPPVLISPVDEGLTPAVFSVFSWTPVIAVPGFQFEYELLIVEIFQGQTPLQAVEANREHVRVTTTQPLIIYTTEYQPLEQGKTYAWMVTANEIDDRIPVSDDGKTEIFTFTVGDLIGGIDFDALDRIQLIPGFAELINLDQLEIAEDGFSLVLNGLATLRLNFAEQGSGFIDILIQCFDLQIRMGDMTEPVVIGGTIHGDVRADLFPHEGIGDIVTVDRIRWSLHDGMTIDAKIIDPSGRYLEAAGTLNLTPAGIFGSITATGPGGTPLFEFGMNPVELIVNKITATFPNAYLTLDARARFFNEPTPCEITDMVASGSSTEFMFSCSINDNIPLIPGRNLATLFLNNAFGAFTIDWNNPAFDFSVTMLGSLRLEALNDRDYRMPARILASSTDGVSIAINPPAIVISPPPINLGIATLQIHQIRDPYLSYDSNTRAWDFGIDFDADIIFPDFDNLKLPVMAGITLDRDGIHFPRFHFDEDDLTWVPRLKLAGFGARLLSFTIPSFTFPWFDWDGMMPGPWDFAFNFELTTPNFRNYLPSCLRNLSLTIEDATFSGGVFTAEVPLTTFAEGQCAFSFGSGFGLNISQLGGRLTGIVSMDEFHLDGELTVGGGVKLSSPFDCKGSSVLGIGTEAMTIKSNGVVEGNLAISSSPCPINIGPFSAGITRLELSFEEGSQQRASLYADAYMDFPVQQGGSTNTVRGTFGLDLMTGEFIELNFSIDEPFVWNIPKDEPVLRFNIDKARITLDGLFIDGRQTFHVGNQQMGVTFDNFVIDITTFTVKRGEIIFDEVFAFEAGIDPIDFSLNYRSVPSTSPLTFDPGLLLELAGIVRIDTTGLRAEGSAQAAIAFAGLNLSPLDIIFSDNFAFGLDPFKVTSGEVEIFYDNSPIAVINQYGFYPMFGLLDIESILPAHLPLPNESVAYLVIKDENEFLVNVVPDSDNLTFTLSTKPGRAVSLVLPILQGNMPEAPRVNIQISDVSFGINPLRFNSGIITTDLDYDLQINLTPLGIPLDLKRVTYGDIGLDDYPMQGLFLTGDLVLFDDRLDDQSQVTLLVKENGTVEGAFNITNLDRDIRLVPGSDLVVINVGSVGGALSVPLLTGGIPWLDCTIGGGFVIQHQDKKARANISAQYNNEGLNIRHFEFDTTYEPPKIDLDPFIFQVNEIHSLSLSHNREDGFHFYSHLDIAFGMRFDEDTLLVPLSGVEIRNNGFVIPNQYISVPELRVPALNILGFRLQPIAFSTDRVVVNVFDFSPDDLSGLIPRMDYDLSFPGLSEKFPSLANFSIAISDAGYKNGIITGMIDFDPLEPVTLALGNPYLIISGFSGNLYEHDSRQSIDVDISGSITELFHFESDTPCDPIEFELAVIQGSGLKGTIENFVPCGVMPIGPLSLSFTSSDAEFDFVDEIQKATLAGSVLLSIPKANEENETTTIEGDLALDLMTGSILDGAIEITNAFRWNMPAGSDKPFLSFTVERARLDTLGLTLKAFGKLDITENVQVVTEFKDLVIGLDDFRIKDGEAVITSDFAFELLFLPVHWRMISRHQELPVDSNVIRLNLQDIGIILNKDGLTFTGESTAQLRLARDLIMEEEEPDEPEEEEFFFGDLRLVFEEGFALAVPPTHARQGIAKLYHDDGDESTLIAWYDTTGLGIGNFLGVLNIPDTLGLPRKDIAYMVLREKNELLVETGTTPDNKKYLRTIEGSSVKIVIPTLTCEDDEPLTFMTTFDVYVNAEYQPIEGSISVVRDPPLKVAGFPLKITGLKYEHRDGVQALTASALLDLPESLKDLGVTLDEIRFSEHGFEQIRVSVGTHPDDYEPPDEDSPVFPEPVYSHEFGDSALIVNIIYAEAAFGTNNEFKVKGYFQSNFFKSEDTEELNNIPFASLHEFSSNTGNRWVFELLDQEMLSDTLDIWLARLWLSAPIVIEAGDDELSLTTSGVMSLPDLMGEDFNVFIDGLKIGTKSPYISVHEITTDIGEQEFQLFGGIIDGTISKITPGFDSDARTLFVTLDGSLAFLHQDPPLVFNNLKIGTDGTFELDGDLFVPILTDEIPLLYDNLTIQQVHIGFVESDNVRKFALKIDGSAKIPAPFASESEFTITVNQKDRYDVEIAISGPEFHFGEGFEIDPERPQISLGDFATLDLRSVGIDIDLKDIERTALYATAAIYLENNTDKRIEVGNVHDREKLKEEWGIRVSAERGIQWGNFTTVSPQGEDLLSLDFDLIYVNVGTLDIYQTDEPGAGGFCLELAGEAGFSLPQIKGSVGYEGFKLTAAGIVDRGSFTPPATFRLLDDKATLELGTYEWFSMDTEPLAVDFVQVDEETGEKETITRNVSQYLKFSGGDSSDNSDNGFALKLTINEGNIGGGVREVLFYREYPTGSLYLKIEDVFLRLNQTSGFQAELTAGMEYADDADGNFLLSVYGAGHITTESDTYGFIGYGKISTLLGHVSWGVFAEVTVPIPLIPGVIDLTSVGGGFFWRPVQKDIDRVLKLIDFEMYRPGDMQGMVNMVTGSSNGGGQPRFAAFLTAGVGMLGAPSSYMIRGKALLQVTNQYIKFDSQTILFPTDGELFGFDTEPLTSVQYLDIDFRRKVVQGGIEIRVNYPQFVTGRSDINFVVAYGSNITWAIWGGIHKFKFIPDIFEANGMFFITSTGFLFELEIKGEANYKNLISVDASFNLEAWWLRGAMFGAYGELAIVISTPVGSLGAGAYSGLFVEGGGYLFFIAGYVEASVWWRDDPVEFHGWLTVESPLKVRGGLGRNQDLLRRIDDARAKREQLLAEFQSLVDELENILNMIEIYSMSAEDLAQAGVNVQNLVKYFINPPDHPFISTPFFIGYLSTIASLKIYEEKLVDPLPAGYEWVMGNIIGSGQYSPQRPSFKAVKDAEDEMNSILSIIKQNTQHVFGSMEDIETQVIQWREDAIFMAQQLRAESPIQKSEIVIDDTTVVPVFSISDDAGDINDVIGDALQSIELFDEAYREAIKAVRSNISAVDEMIQTSGEMTIFEFADLLVEGIEALGNYFRKFSDYNWQFKEWAEDRHQRLYVQKADIEISLNHTANAAREAIRNTEYEKVNDLLVFRYRLLQFFAGNKEFKGAADSFRNKLDRYSDSELITELNNLGQNLWFDIHDLGLTALSTGYQEAAEQMANVYPEILNTQHYISFTERLNNIYVLKSELLTILYGMVEEYIAWREDDGDDSKDEYVSLLADITIELEVPVITSMVANQLVKNTFAGTETLETPSGSRIIPIYAPIPTPGVMDLSWNAAHPREVIETSFSFIRDGGLSIYEHENILTTGNRNGLRFYAIKEQPNDRSHQYSFAVRARGSGGTTAMRTGLFEVAVDEDGTYTSPGTNILPVVTSKPTTPTVEFPYRFLSSGRQTSYWDRFSRILVLGSYWTNDPSRIEMTLSAFDDMADIAAFEYAVGSTKGGRDILDWAVAQGVRPAADDPYAGYANTVLKTTIRNLQMEHNTPYYVSVRARNIAGNYSDVYEVATPVRYDATGPTNPTQIAAEFSRLNIIQPVSTLRWPSTTQVSATPHLISELLTDVPHYPSFPYVTPDAPPAQPEITVGWIDSNDPESSIYRYIVSSSPRSLSTIIHHPGAWLTEVPDEYAYTQEPSITFKGGGLNHGDTLYFHVQAENYAGSLSESVLTVGPLSPRDPTPPTRPTVRSRVRKDGIHVYITQFSVDWETLVEGFQYSVGTEPGKDDIIPWPAGISFPQVPQLDFGPAAIVPSTPPYFTVGSAGLPPDTEIYVNVRAVNGQSMYSDVVSNGPIIFNSTPEPPIVAVDYNGSSVSIEIGNIIDYGLPVASVSRRILNAYSGEVLSNWAPLAAFNPGHYKTPQSISKEMKLSDYNFAIKVEVRVTNTAGIAATASDAWYPQIDWQIIYKRLNNAINVQIPVIPMVRPN